MECTDQIFASAAVNGGLATNAAVNLCQQTCRDLHEMAAALHDMGGKAGNIADHAAAQRDDMVAALDMSRKQPVDQPLQFGPVFRTLTCRQLMDFQSQPCTCHCRAETRKDMGCNVAVGHQQKSSATGQR